MEIGDDPEKTARVVSGGRASNGVEIRLVDDDGRDVPLGEVGEIAVKSNSLMAGFWNQAEKTKNAFRDGYYLTNDMAYMDEEGYHEPFPRDGLEKVRRKDLREKYWVGYGRRRFFKSCLSDDRRDGGA